MNIQNQPLIRIFAIYELADEAKADFELEILELKSNAKVVKDRYCDIPLRQIVKAEDSIQAYDAFANSKINAKLNLHGLEVKHVPKKARKKVPTKA